MMAVVDGKRWRIRFNHTIVKPGQRAPHRRKGLTQCSIEVWSETPEEAGFTSAEGWTRIASGSAVCGSSEPHFQKEKGRQFALIRALAADTISRTVKGALLTAYIKSGGAHGRGLCHDLRVADDGWVHNHTLYDVVFGGRYPDFIAKVKESLVKESQ